MTLQPFGPWPLFQFLNPIHSRLGSLNEGWARRKAATYKQNNTNTVGFELTTPVFERAKMLHALDRAATVISSYDNIRINYGFVSNSVHYYGDIFVTSCCDLNNFGLQSERTFIRRMLLRLLSSIQRDTPEGDMTNTTSLRFLLSPNRPQEYFFRGWWSRGPGVIVLYQPTTKAVIQSVFQIPPA
jgi:hypothetical protein